MSSAAIALALLGCVETPPQLPAEGDQRAVAAAESAPVAAPAPAAATADEASWQRLAQQLEVDNRRLELEREHWKGEAERYHQGLERAVAELNRVNQTAAAAIAAQAARPPQPAPGRSAGEARVSTLGAPDLQFLGDVWLVTGRLWNAGDADAEGLLEIEVLRDGVTLRSLTQPFRVAARTEVSYSQRFPLGSPSANATYSARVSPRY